MTKSPVACLRPYTYAVPVKVNKWGKKDCSQSNRKLLEHICGISKQAHQQGRACSKATVKKRILPSPSLPGRVLRTCALVRYP